MNGNIHSVGEIVGSNRYTIQSFIGQGGMQEVYCARDLVLNRDVALKVPKNSAAARRFKRSAVLSARVSHPNAAKTLDYFEEAGRFYLVEEFLAGADLAKVRADLPLMDPYVAAHILHHLAKGIAALHHVDVVHRDLKPSNIMVGGGIAFRSLKITDFGIAKMAEAELNEAIEGGEPTITSSATVKGALPYLAPEAIEKPREARQPADIWSIGAIAYDLLSGKKPFGSGLMAVPAILASAPPAVPEWINRPQFKELGTRVYEIILECLRREPAERPDADKLVLHCESLCYPPASRRVGTVENYAGSSFGFITSDGSEVFFHQDSVYGPLPKIGNRVWFAQFAGSPRDRAHPIVTMAVTPGRE